MAPQTEIVERLARIETLLQGLTRECPTRETRIRSLEDDRTRVRTWIAAVALVWAPLCAYLAKHFGF